MQLVATVESFDLSIHMHNQTQVNKTKTNWNKKKKIRNLNCHSQNEDIEKLNANNYMKRMQISSS